MSTMNCAGYINGTAIFLNNYTGTSQSTPQSSGFEFTSTTANEQPISIAFPSNPPTSIKSCAISDQLIVIGQYSKSTSLVKYNFASNQWQPQSSSSISVSDGIVAPCIVQGNCYMSLATSSSSSSTASFQLVTSPSAIFSQTIPGLSAPNGLASAGLQLVYDGVSNAYIVNTTHVMWLPFGSPSSSSGPDGTPSTTSSSGATVTASSTDNGSTSDNGPVASGGFGHATFQRRQAPVLASNIFSLNPPLQSLGSAVYNAAEKTIVVASVDGTKIESISLSNKANVLNVLPAPGTLNPPVQAWLQTNPGGVVYLPGGPSSQTLKSSPWSSITGGSSTPSSTTAAGPDQPNGNHQGASLSSGAIAGIVVGIVVFVAVVIGAVMFLSRRRHRRAMTHSQSHHQLVEREDVKNKEIQGNNGQANYCSLARHDDVETDPATAVTKALLAGLVQSGQIHLVDIHAVDVNSFDPMHGIPTLASTQDVFDLEPGMTTHPHRSGYVLRSAKRRSDGQDCTVHYMTPLQSHTFARNVEASGSMIHPQDLTVDSAVLVTLGALALPRPTAQGFQYIWITSHFDPDHTLQRIFLDGQDGDSPIARRAQLPFDPRDHSFKAWATLSLLRATKFMHTHNWIHRDLQPMHLFYSVQATDWAIQGFDHAVYTPSNHRDDTHSLPHHIFMAPERLSNPTWLPSAFVSPSIDVWSLGLCLYTLATGEKPFESMYQYQNFVERQTLQGHVEGLVASAGQADASFQLLLSRMLQVNPDLRDSLDSLIHLWIQENQLEDE